MRLLILLLVTLNISCAKLDQAVYNGQRALKNLERISEILDRRPASGFTVSIYDSPTDKSKVVVEVCGPHKCATLLTPKATLQADYEAIQTWALSVEPEL